LALIFHELQRASAKSTGDDEGIDAQTIRSAIRLVHYFKSHVHRVRGRIVGRLGGVSENAQAVLEWARRNNRAEFSERDLWKYLWRRFRDKQEMGRALRELCRADLIRSADAARASDSPGRTPTPTYKVHPELKYAPPKGTKWTKPCQGPEGGFVHSVPFDGAPEDEGDDPATQSDLYPTREPGDEEDAGGNGVGPIGGQDSSRRWGPYKEGF
jgi:hypothetical protein